MPSAEVSENLIKAVRKASENKLDARVIHAHARRGYITCADMTFMLDVIV